MKEKGDLGSGGGARSPVLDMKGEPVPLYWPGVKCLGKRLEQTKP